MKLTITCQTCGKLLSIVEKDQMSEEDIALYEQSSSCDTIKSVDIDSDGNTITIYDGQDNIQVSRTQV